jgi:hypothetical protein
MTGLQAGAGARDTASKLASLVRAAHTLREGASRGDAIGWHDARPIGRTPLATFVRAREP